MKIALASSFSTSNDIMKNIETIKDLTIKIENNIDLVCFGEAFLQGFNALKWDYNVDKELAVNSSSHYINEIKVIAKNNNIGIGFGFFELLENAIFCSYMIINNKGEVVDIYRRVSIGWKEHEKTDHHYKEGNCFNVFSYNGHKIITALCGDLWYDDNVSKINEIDADIILWPLHVDYSLKQWNIEKNDYVIQTSKINKPILFVNNYSNSSLGGCYLFTNGMIEKELKLGKQGILICIV
ncbi:MAG: carbon-nitrogen hydrolase family protein [Acholeplasma sp.]|nr:carbon-nitrogen hydrolase family protein [Acholeplasma sp.]